MTLKLYAYDSDGTEIAWVTSDPYEYFVESSIEDQLENSLTEKFDEWEVIVEWGSESSNDRGGHTTTETFTALDDLSSEEHLSKISNRLEFFYCDSTEIVDE